MMNATPQNQSATLAGRLLSDLQCAGVSAPNADLLRPGAEDLGPLGFALYDIEDGDLMGGLEFLNQAVRQAMAPPSPFTAGPASDTIRERARLMLFAQVARVLVLDAIKATDPTAQAHTATHTERA